MQILHRFAGSIQRYSEELSGAGPSDQEQSSAPEAKQNYRFASH